MGDIIVPNITPITVIMNIKVKDNQIKGTSDCPIQGTKNHYIDSIWVDNDSIFTDQSTMCGPGAKFKGLILPGDSVIDGKWFQGEANFP